jgi:hypothetical protein
MRSFYLLGPYLIAGLLLTPPALASASPVLCTTPATLTAPQQDRLLRMSAAIKGVLATSGSRVALIARNGTNLDRLGVHFSHAGLALADNGLGAWGVRQLYYHCEEAAPRVFDQGLAGFLGGTDDADHAAVSLVLMQGEPARQLEAAARDDTLASALVAPSYSASAYAWRTTHQNCNQWLVELMAAAWAPLSTAWAPLGTPWAPLNASTALRTQAQTWLAAQGYEPQPLKLHSHLLMMAAPFVPFVRLDDHPIDDLHALQLHVSLPASMERFVRRLQPHAERVVVCLDADRVVVQRGWHDRPGATAQERCTPQPNDQIIEASR